MKKLLLLTALILTGCATQVQTLSVPPDRSGDALKAMDNCERSLKNQQQTNDLSPQCYCVWQPDNEFNARRGTFPNRYTEEAVVQCDTCDPFQVGGIECGDTSQLP